MSKPMYSPAPWREIINRDGTLNIATNRDSEGESYKIALVNNYNRANARLIAAAPELYEALKAMLFKAEHGNGLEAHYKVNEAARAALAKAEGKT